MDWDCEETAKCLAEDRVSELSAADREALAQHLRGCDACRSQVAEDRALDELLCRSLAAVAPFRALSNAEREALTQNIRTVMSKPARPSLRRPILRMLKWAAVLLLVVMGAMAATEPGRQQLAKLPEMVGRWFSVQWQPRPGVVYTISSNRPFDSEEAQRALRKLAEADRLIREGKGRLASIVESPDRTTYTFECTLSTGEVMPIDSLPLTQAQAEALHLEEIEQLRRMGEGRLVSQEDSPIGLGSFSVAYTLSSGEELVLRTHYPPGPASDRERIFDEIRTLRKEGKGLILSVTRDATGHRWGIVRYTLSNGRTVGVIEPLKPHELPTAEAMPPLGTLNVPSAEYPTIQSAIDAAGDGDTIVVAPGIYTENINFRGKAITLTSTDPDDPGVVASTVIDGAGKGSIVVFNHGETSRSVLTGLTIRNGRAGLGGGISCSFSSPTITKNVITGNTAQQGAGISCTDGSAPRIANNTITENTSLSTIWGGGSIFCCTSSSPEIADNTISGNIGKDGGGITCYFSSSPRITGNTIRENGAKAGGGIYCVTNSSPEITGNVITRNSAGHGGGIWISQSSPRITGNTITENSVCGVPEFPVGNGGGIRCSANSSPTIANNVISRNSGGGVYCLLESAPTITNNTIAMNSVHGVGVESGTGVAIRANSIYANEGPGIDLGNDGPTANDPGDADGGANNLQNFPRLVSATYDGGRTTIVGTLNSAPDSEFIIEFFANSVADVSGSVQGETFLGSTTAKTDGSGNANFEVSFPLRVANPELITATATDPDSNTSEFSLSRPTAGRSSHPPAP